MQLNEHVGIGMTSQRTRDRLVARLSDQGIDNIALLDVMRSTPRHVFIDEALSHRAYEDAALPIGQGQTISQPFIVALMTQVLLSHGKLDSVLEVGTGCGYQTAVLSQLVKRVCTMERIGSLQEGAEQRLRQLGLRNIEYRHGDGYVGWKARAPFDGIIITAAPREIPKMLLAQLALGGKMVLPVGEDGSQALQVITKTAEGFETEPLIPVRFVPLQSGILA
ncbi:MAG: protein-L-isoaspartate(D-aspartate) O-methyltransferase [Pseudomonadales bacterium]|nr:protein-L-isoaspartate(D-aspartate) O-methyltransferase [Pseudomonadales bacterium]